MKSGWSHYFHLDTSLGMKLTLVLTAVFMLLSTPVLALYGGRPLVAGEGKAVVSLHLSDPQNSEYDFFCNGVLIDTDTILTTGHCIEGMASEVYERWYLFEYRPDLLKVKASGKFYEVADVKLSPNYTEGHGFGAEDLAIIKLKNKIRVTPLKLARTEDLHKDQPVTLIARGQMAQTRILSLKSFSGQLIIFTDGTNAGVCQGDSGGALVVQKNGQDYLAGILSAQREGCKKGTDSSIFPRRF